MTVSLFSSLKKSSIGGALTYLLKIPVISTVLKKEINKTKMNFKNGLDKALYKPLKQIPNQGWSRTEIIDRLNEYSMYEYNKVSNAQFSGVRFTDNKELEDIAGEASKRFLYTNMMYFKKATPSRHMENEIISWTKNLLNGQDSTTGITTTGGSDSIFLGVLAHKRYYFKEHGIKKPEIIMPESAHPAFIKACQFTDVKPVILKCNRENGTVKSSQYKAAITKNTICFVCSAPNLPYGTVDPIEEVSKLAGDYKIGLFVDGCMGSMLLPFVDQCRVQTGERYVDLRNKNVSCMSCDVHKYGMTPKGISVLLFPNDAIKKSLFFGVTDWVGGLYGTHTIQGSRPSSIIAAAWSVMAKVGYEG